MRRGDVVGELEKGPGHFQLTWRIANFMSLPEKGDISYDSPLFYFSNLRWFLRIFPKDGEISEEWIGIYLTRYSHGPPLSVRFAIGIKTADGKEDQVYNEKFEFTQDSPCLRFPKCLKRSELLERQSELAPSGALTVVCRMWTGVEEQGLVSREIQTGVLADSAAKEAVCAQLNAKGVDILRKHFRDYLHNTEDHDVTLKVRDEQFKAHKSILRARSPVFTAMFAPNAAENECGEVCIDDCNPKAFSEFLKYVYSAKFENMPPNTTMGLYYIADKYEFPDLKESCVKFLKASITANTISDIITLATLHGEDELLHVAMEFFSNHMIEVFTTAEWQRFIVKNPLKANEIIIKATKIKSVRQNADSSRGDGAGPPLKKQKKSTGKKKKPPMLYILE